MPTSFERCATAIALALGLTTALVAGRALERYLYGIGPRDPATFAAAAGVIALVAMLASGWPAWRAARVDPMLTLRRQ